MTKYILYKEYVEISAKGLKQYGDVYSTYMVEKGMRNGGFEIIGEYETKEEARAELTKVKTEVRLTRGCSNVKFYSGWLYYFEESEYDEEWEEWSPGDGDSAEEIINE